MGVTFVLVFSILIQLAAAFLALRLISITGRRAAWILIATAIFFMAVRRCITLFESAFFNVAYTTSLSAELVALVISILMLTGMILIAPLFRSLKQSEEALRKARDGLEMRVQERTASLTEANQRLEQEITEREETERQLRYSEERYRNLYEEAPNAYFSVGTDARIERANSRAAELLGYSLDEMLGQPVFNLYAETPDGRDKAQRLFQRFLAGEDILDAEVEMRRADGSRIWVSLTVRPIRDKEGRVVASRSVAEDITERKKLEQLKDEFIGLVSHELRTPLTVINGCLSTVLTEWERLPTGEVQQLLRDAVLESESLSHLVENLLELSRVQAQQLALYLEPTDVKTLVTNTLAKVKRQAPTHQFVTSVPDELQLIKTDPLRIERILYNLLENAAKYSPSGSQIKVTATPEPERLIIGVRDQGKGLSPREKAKLFSPFQRLESSRPDRARGTGLGLVVCRVLVEAHGGEIWVESKKGAGSTFFFSLPYLKDAKDTG